MADFELDVDFESFDELGVRPDFNSVLYGELLDEVIPGQRTPSVYLSPHVSFGKNLLGKFGLMLTTRDEFENSGGYTASTEELTVLCTEDTDTNNSLLLRNTHLHVQNVMGDLEGRQEAQVKRANAIFKNTIAGGVGLGAFLYVFTDIEPVLGAVTVIPGYAAMLHAATNSPQHSAAKKFAKSSEIQEAYGHIITYR
jgi:hypothetical protein